MYFVVQAEVDDGLLLLHNMTKEMVLLSQEEQRVFGQCPTDLPELIDRWFLVPTGHNDCKLSRQILSAVPCYIYAYCLMPNHVHLLIAEKSLKVGEYCCI